MEANFLLGKVRKILRSWSNKMLTWDGKTAMLKHILWEIQGYHLLMLSLNQQGCEKLEKACRLFLWGTNEEGKAKKALISWDDISQPREEGGLDIRPFKQQAKALKMRKIAQVLEGRETKWIWIMEVLIKDALKSGPHKKDKNNWSGVEAIFLDSKLKITNSTTTKGLLNGWSEANQDLKFQFFDGAILQGASIDQLLKLYKAIENLGEEIIRVIRTSFVAKKIK